MKCSCGTAAKRRSVVEGGLGFGKMPDSLRGCRAGGRDCRLVAMQVAPAMALVQSSGLGRLSRRWRHGMAGGHTTAGQANAFRGRRFTAEVIL